MINSIDNTTQRKAAKIAGLLYLLVIVFGIIGHLARQSLIVPGDAATTAKNIMANEMQFRGANLSWLISEMSLLLLGLALYVVLKKVNKNLASLMVLFVVVGVAVESINTLNQFAALQLLSGANHLTAFSADQLTCRFGHSDRRFTIYSSSRLRSDILPGERGCHYWGICTLRLAFVERC